MKVLQVSTFFTEHGGVERSVADLSSALAVEHDVSVLCTRKGESTRDSFNGIDVTAAGGQITLSGRPLAMNFPIELSARSVDVVHYHLPCPIAVVSQFAFAPKAKIKVATWHHDLVRHKLFNQLLGPANDRFLNTLDRIIVTAPALIENTPLLKRYAHKCTVIPLGVRNERFEKIDLDEVQRVRAEHGTPLILYVGRLVYYKGCEILLRAIAQVPGSRLIMVGTGPLEQRLHEQIAEHGLSDRVKLLGWQSESQIKTLFQACDIFVLPSTLETECFGLAQVEAMLCGKPIVNTDLPTGVPWVSVHGETGLTVTPGDSTGLAQAIQLLVDDGQLRKRLGNNARKRALSMFTLEQHLSATLSLYDELLQRQRPAVRTTGSAARR
ncbi:MAG: glycosyltransferase [Terriglobales bacterium]